jgi:hypothetical protein
MVSEQLLQSRRIANNSLAGPHCRNAAIAVCRGWFEARDGRTWTVNVQAADLCSPKK